ncbi:MAG: protease SohB [Pseudomonadales bacterium]|nr:protease SohB [Pseudomonadales bacterium]
MEYLIEYGLFLAKTVTLVFAIIAILGALMAAGNRNRRQGNKGEISVTHLNEEFDHLSDTLKRNVLDKHAWKLLQKKERKQQKQQAKQDARLARKKLKATDEDEQDEARRKRVYVLNFNGDIAASAVDSLRQEISAVLALAEATDEVLLRLESPGGMVHAYGLAASQLQRIKDNNISLTICVDKVAASGGYMMACLADRLIAAPFAILGSIGVLVQLPNFHRVLKKNDVDYETITAGEYKTTLTSFGEITQKGRDKVKEEVEEMHRLFKQWVQEHRPNLDIDAISTGETWVGLQALSRNMIDTISTSDDCILQACAEADVYEVRYEYRKSLTDRLGFAVETSLGRALKSIGTSLRNTRFYS